MSVSTKMKLYKYVNNSLDDLKVFIYFKRFGVYNASVIFGNPFTNPYTK